MKDRGELEKGSLSQGGEENISEEYSCDNVWAGPGGNGALLSRRRALKLAGVATLGSGLGLLGSQEVAEARRRKKKRPSPTPPAPRLDVNVPGPPDDFIGGIIADTRGAQVFTPTIFGSLTTVTFVVAKGGPRGDYLIQINETFLNGNLEFQPTNSVLASTTIGDRLVPDGISTVTATFATPAQVVPTVSYALVISRPGSSGSSIGVRNGNPYAGGISWGSPSLSGDFTPNNNVDLVFSTFVL